MNWYELRGLLRGLLRDEVEPFLWSDAILQSLVNQAYVDVVQTVGQPRMRTPFHLAAGDDTITIAEKVLSPTVGVHIDNRIVAGAFDLVNSAYVLADPVPKPTNGVYTYVPLPPPLVGSTDVPSLVPPEWHHTLAYWAAYSALLIDDAEGRNDNLAATYYKRYRADIARYRTTLDRQGRLQLTARPQAAYI